MGDRSFHALARRIHVWSPAQQMDSRANKCDVTIGNDMTSQSRKDLRRCVLSHWRFIQLSLRIVIISHWMLLHNSWTLYVSTNPSIYLHVYVVYLPRNGRIQRPHLRSVNVTVTSSWTFCFAGTTTRCSFGINDQLHFRTGFGYFSGYQKIDYQIFTHPQYSVK